ncbi:MAG: nucleoside deaminase [Candidatus Sericytochromatia bacterium]
MIENLDPEYFMNLAFHLSKKAFEIDEVPVGAVIIYKNQVIGTGYNKKENDNLVTSHAELIAINEASKTLNNWRLIDCEMYVTLEPCPMCAGAIIQSRLSKVFYGAKNTNYGSFESILRLQDYYPDSKNIQIFSGLMEEEVVKLLKHFFRKKVNKK